MRIALVTGGHPFDRSSFFEVFDSFDLSWEHVPHPDALSLVQPGRAAEYDVFVMYDMPGIEFTRGDPPARFIDPPAEYRAGFRSLLDAGKGMVFLHHAIAGWPTWDEYGAMIGGRFLYQPATVSGVARPDSGYRHDVAHTVDVIDESHPVCSGLGSSFDIVDEVYLFHVDEDEVTPLLRSRHDFTDSSFYSADRAIRGDRNSRTGWHHERGSNLVAWTRSVGAAPVAYIQFGDGPQTYADPNYRRLLLNTIRWAGASQRSAQHAGQA